MYPVKVSDIIIKPYSVNASNKLLRRPVKTITNKEIGIVENLILNEYGAIKYVIIKQSNGMLIRLKASQLWLQGESIVLQEPQAIKILDVVAELNMVCRRLIEILKKNLILNSAIIRTVNKTVNNQKVVWTDEVLK